MIRLRVSEAAEEFRAEFRHWLEKNPAPKAASSGLEDFIRSGRLWQEKLAAANWVGVHWPKEYGGRSLSLVEEAIVQEELVRADSPQLLGLFGLTMVGPVLIQHGTDQQRQRFLSKILNCSEIWCQGFSEPGAGSDLAALQCRAEPCQGGFRVSGQKVWTSFAHIADWCFLLCRTSVEKKKHQGLTYLLVDMKSEGIETRPLRQISGDDEFNEVFFDEVFVPESHVVGQAGQGWKIAISTLMYERVVLTFARQLQSEVALRELLSRSAAMSEMERSRLAELVAEACAVRALAYEHLLAYADGKLPGPEGSLDKLFWSESFQRVAKFALSIQGRAAGLSEGAEENEWAAHQYLYSRGRTIAAGTSEIQRSIVAERVLGLPRLRFSE